MAEKVNEIEENEKILNTIMKEESRIVPPKKLILMFIFLVSIFLLNLIRGESGKSIAGIVRCSGAFWAITCMLPVVTLIFVLIFVRMVKREEKIKEKVGYVFDSKDLKFTNKNIVILLIAGFIGGFLTGAVNAGASLAVLPVLLHLGMHARVASATSGFNTAWIAITLIANVI